MRTYNHIHKTYITIGKYYQVFILEVTRLKTQGYIYHKREIYKRQILPGLSPTSNKNL